MYEAQARASVSLQQCHDDSLHELILAVNNLRFYLETNYDGHLADEALKVDTEVSDELF